MPRQPAAQRRFARPAQSDQGDPAMPRLAVGFREMRLEQRVGLAEPLGREPPQDLGYPPPIGGFVGVALDQPAERQVQRVADPPQQFDRNVPLTAFELREIALRQSGIARQDPACHAAPRAFLAHPLAEPTKIIVFLGSGWSDFFIRQYRHDWESCRCLTGASRKYNRPRPVSHRRGQTIPEGLMTYNAAADLLERNLVAGRGAKTAFIDDRGRYTYAELADRAGRFANLLRRFDIRPEQRILLCLHDTIDFPTAFLGAIKAGVVPVAVNTQLSAAEYTFMLADSRARAVVVSGALLPVMTAALAELPGPQTTVIVSGADEHEQSVAALLAEMSGAYETAATHPDEPCFWLYSSGSTGRPNGTVHIHSSLIQTAQLYALPVLGIAENDVVFSAAKLFFAYGLGNSLTFPMAVGATSVLMAERPTPAAISRVLRAHQPTIFYGVPTLYNAMLAGNDLPRREELSLRRCVSAGEPLPPEIGRRWMAQIGVDILDGIGSTEMLHIFLSNRPGEVRYGTTGKPIPGYDLKIVDESERLVQRGEIGDLLVNGPTSAAFYWN